MKFTNLDGKKIAFEITDIEMINDGKPVLFILPGGPGYDRTPYKAFYAPHLSEVAHLVFIDPRGCGQSDRYQDRSSYTMNGYTADVECLRKHLHLERISILGVSYGSMAALNYAVQHPEVNIEHLILVGGAPSFHFIDKARQNLLAQGTPEQIALCDKVLWDGHINSQEESEHYGKIMRSMYSMRIRNGKITKNPYSSIPFSPDPNNEAWSTHFWEFDLEKQLSTITAKDTQIIFGEYDWINDPYFARLMAKRIPNAHLYLLPNSGHSVATDQPQLYLNILLDTLRPKTPKLLF